MEVATTRVAMFEFEILKIKERFSLLTSYFKVGKEAYWVKMRE